MLLTLITNLLGYGVYVGLIRLRHTHVSPLPLFIFTLPDICISHKLPQRVLWSEAEMNNAWQNQGVSWWFDGVYYCRATFDRNSPII